MLLEASLSLFFVLENHIFPLKRTDQALTRKQHSPVCGPTGEIMVIIKTLRDALGSLKGPMDIRVRTENNQIETMKTHLVSNKEVSSKFFGSARHLSRLKCNGFITEKAYAA